MTALTGVEAQPAVLGARIVWTIPAAAQEIAAVRVYVKTAGAASYPATPAFEGLGSVLSASKRYADVTGLTAGQSYTFSVRPAREA